jgi:hypothetical protein
MGSSHQSHDMVWVARTVTAWLSSKIAEHNRGQHYNGQPGGCPLCPPDLAEPTDLNKAKPTDAEDRRVSENIARNERGRIFKSDPTP